MDGTLCYAGVAFVETKREPKTNAFKRRQTGGEDVADEGVRETAFQKNSIYYILITRG